MKRIVSRLIGMPDLLYECIRWVNAADDSSIACTNLELTQLDVILTVLDQRPFFYSRFFSLKAKTILGWGRKWSGKRAVALAAKHKCDFWLVEDGFLRSLERDGHALSLVLDSSGIYYDSTEPSEFEQLARTHLTDAERLRARNLIALWRSECLSKYNSARDRFDALADKYVLVCDQTFGDASISYGLASTKSFNLMLNAALAEYPHHTIVLKTHPDVVRRGKKGHFDLTTLANNDRVQIIADPVHPSMLIEHADAVYTVTSQMGFEALIWGKRVRCFGMPFYAGWGLTDDKLPAPDRRKPVTLEHLVYAALVKYPRYIDPVTMQRCEPEVTFKHVGLQRRKRQEFPEQITAIGFSRWKRPFIANFLLGSGVFFAKRLKMDTPSNPSEAVAVWGSSKSPFISEGIQLLRIEDGFLRSSGLGADLVRPLSLVIDDIGIYYDPTRPSRLERILETQDLNDAAICRARALREKLIHSDVTKYNLGKQSWTRPDTSTPVLLVVGQVETDASIRLGSPDVTSNIELLRRVRHENPQAYIVYKPHPDVLAGLRRRGRGEDTSQQLADEILTAAVSLGQLLRQVDQLHTMTSLMGFEALIRGGKVVCHGLPFYAGWGLTEDRVSCVRRTRRLTVDQLVYGALISYPRYFNYERKCFIEPEHAIDQLAAWAEAGPTSRTWPRKLLRVTILAWLKLKGSTR